MLCDTFSPVGVLCKEVFLNKPLGNYLPIQTLCRTVYTLRIEVWCIENIL